MNIQDGSVEAGLLLLEMTPPPDGQAWSQKEIAEVCGVSDRYIYKLEMSAIRKMRMAFMERLGHDGIAEFTS